VNLFSCTIPCWAASIAPVGTATLGAGLWGQIDLVGEVFEWNADWYAEAYVEPCTDCAYLTAVPPPADRVSRGGSFYTSTSVLHPPNRDNEDPARRDYTNGVRCARSPL
jgi:sulfatase modifying factor 1